MLEELKKIEIESLQNPKKFLWWHEDMKKMLSVQMQAFIRMRCGVDDYDIQNPKSRPAQIIKQIKKLKSQNLINDKFSLIDITCSDAINLYHIKNKFKESDCFGIDCEIGDIDTHKMVERAGVNLFKGYIQNLFVKNFNIKFDVAIMLNTYRSWESANLTEEDKNLPELADNWFKNNSRFTILTATNDQIKKLKKKGFKVDVFGKGEDNSKMIYINLK